MNKKFADLPPKRAARAVSEAVKRAAIEQARFHVIFEDFAREHTDSSPLFVKFEELYDGIITIEIFPDPARQNSDRYTKPFLGYVIGTNVYPKKALDNLVKYLAQEPD